MNQLLNPNLTDEQRLAELKKYLISQTRDFCCPISKEILDYRSTHIVKFKLGDKITRDIISHKGWSKIPLETKQRAAMEIVTQWDEV